jgi:hypothetical protein
VSERSWRTVRFAELAEPITDRVDNPSSAGVDRYVGLEHLDPERLRIARWGSPADVSSTKLRFERGDVIFGKRRAYQRKLAVADFSGICSAHAMVLRPREENVEPSFLPFFLQSDAFFERAIAISVGSLSPTINWSALAGQEFELPPRRMQRRIATLLQAAQESAYCAEAVWHAARRAAAAHAAEFFASCAEPCPLETVAEVRSGLTVNRSRRSLDRQVPYLRVANVGRDRIDITELKSIGAASRDTQRYALRAGDILVVEGHADRKEVGRAAIWTAPIQPCLHQNHLFCVRATEAVRPGFLALALQSPALRSYFSARAKSTSGLHTINSTAVRQAPVPVPSLPAQDAFLAAHARYTSCDDAYRHAVDVSWELARALREEILKGGSARVQ